MKKLMSLLPLIVLTLVVALYTACKKEQKIIDEPLENTVEFPEKGKFEKELVISSNDKTVVLSLSSDDPSALDNYAQENFSFYTISENFFDTYTEQKADPTSKTENLNLGSAVFIEIKERNFKDPFNLCVKSSSFERTTGNTWWKDNQDYGLWGHHKIQVLANSNGVMFNGYYKSCYGNNGSCLHGWVLNTFGLTNNHYKTYDHGGNWCYGIRVNVLGGSYIVSFASKL